jgi:hypothetical protein
MHWPSRLENGELLKAAETALFDVLVTSDQSIVHQQNPKGRKLALVVLGSNIWSIVGNFGGEIASKIAAARPGTSAFIEMPLPPKSPKR